MLLLVSLFISLSSDPLTLVECAQFASIGKIQPFSVTFSTNALLVIVSVNIFVFIIRMIPFEFTR